MFEIVEAYKTSKGVFLNKEDALKKENRNFTRDSYNGTGGKEYELPSVIYLLKHNDTYFYLNQADPK